MAHSQPNLILSRLTDSDFQLIEADLEDVDLPVRKVLEQPQRRIDSVYFLTREFLAMMLGVRRPGVTVAVQLLEQKGLIERQRASIVIIDRKALEKLSNGTYAPAVYN